MHRLAQFKTIVFLAVFVFTFILRAHSYERVPTSNHLDEMLYAWSGINMIETGTPISWSTLDYPKRAEVYKGMISYKGGIPEASVTLYKPWLDEPPLFSLIVGYFAHINGANRNEFIPSSYIRIPMVIIASIVSILVFAIAKHIGGFKTGILAMLFYGLTPTFVFGSRTAMPENLIALCFLIIIWLFLKYREKLKFVLILPIPILIGISGLSKPTGFFLLLFSIFILVWFSLKKVPAQKIIKRVIYLILGTAPFVAFYFWYSYHLDPEIFKVIFSIQSGRPAGFSSFVWFLISPAYDTFVFKDGWYLFSLVYALYLIIKPGQEIKIKYISLAFVFWTLVVMFTGGEGDLLSWYRFPLFPILSIICAIGIINLVKLNNFFSTFIFFGLLLGSRYLLVNAFHHNIQALDYRRWMFICLAPSLLYWLFKVKILKSLNKFIAISIIIVGLFLNTVLIYNYFDLICEAKTCSMVPTTKLSVIRFPFIWRFFTLDNFK